MAEYLAPSCLFISDVEASPLDQQQHISIIGNPAPPMGAPVRVSGKPTTGALRGAPRGPPLLRDHVECSQGKRLRAKSQECIYRGPYRATTCRGPCGGASPSLAGAAPGELWGMEGPPAAAASCCCSESTSGGRGCRCCLRICNSCRTLDGSKEMNKEGMNRKEHLCLRRCCCYNKNKNNSNNNNINRNHNCRKVRKGESVKWEKVLWRKQLYPDCYVDETFLNNLYQNRNISRYIYFDLCSSTVVLTQHLSCILLFLFIYKMIVKKTLKANTLVAFNVAALPLGYALRWALRPAPRARQVLQSGVIVFGVLRILAPVLQTLTQSFSDDTVINLTSVCLLIHIPLNDYSYVYRNPGVIDEPLGRLMSLNVALFASVLLASRLSTSSEVFAFLFFGIEVFALSPMARRYLLLLNPWAFTYVVTPLLIFLTSFLMYFEGSAIIMLLYLFLMFFITFVGPYWLIRCQKYKNEINGPWDIPRIKNHT